MGDPLEKQVADLGGQYLQLFATAAADLQIDAAERKRLDAVGDKIAKLRAQLRQKSIDSVVGTLKTDPAQLKKFQQQIKALPVDAQAVAADVLETMYKTPRPPDELDRLRKSMASLSADKGMAVGKALNQIGVYLPNLKPDSPGAEDASARIKKVHMSGDYGADRVQADYIRDIIRQAKAEKFKVVLQVVRGTDTVALLDQIARDMAGTVADVSELKLYCEVLEADRTDYVWAEDNKWLTADGATVRTSPKLSDVTFDKLSKFTGALDLKPGQAGYSREGHHAAGPSADPGNNQFPAGLVDEGAAQGAVSGRNEHLSAEALARATGKTVVTTRTYNEGGNMLAGAMPNGQPYAVIGRDGLLLSAFHLQETFDADPTKAPEFANANVDSRVKSMTFDGNEVSQTIKRLQASGAMPAGADAARQQKEAKAFLAKLDIVKDIFAADTKVPRDQLIFVAQPDFHIDMHMRPLGPGQVMINDFDANIKLIDDALKLAAKGSWEESELKNMRDHAAQIKKVLGPVMDEIKKQCKSGGLDVVPAPGVMEGQYEKATVASTSRVGRYLGLSADKDFTRAELGKALIAKAGGAPSDSVRRAFDETLDDMYTRHVNFMNAIPGTTSGSNQQFYATNSTSVGPLQKAYENYLKSRGVEKVYWIGDDGGGNARRSTSEQSLQAMGGLDCRENH
ncbi:MAG: hypothetical protein ACRCT8_01740 [Lacipirellulaceae bacterium]